MKPHYIPSVKSINTYKSDHVLFDNTIAVKTSADRWTAEQVMRSKVFVMEKVSAVIKRKASSAAPKNSRTVRLENRKKCEFDYHKLQSINRLIYSVRANDDGRAKKMPLKDVTNIVGRAREFLTVAVRLKTHIFKL